MSLGSYQKTCKSLSTVKFSTYILKIIRNLHTNKALGQDMISISMLKIRQESICKPQGIYFRSYLGKGKFPSEWKKSQCGSCLQKNNKQELKNY